MSDLKRKSAEAIALKFRTAPRTLQRFLESNKWDEEELLGGSHPTTFSRATESPFTIIDDTTPLDTIDVNQEQPPGDLKLLAVI